MPAYGSRRAFLSSLGVAAAASPFVPIFNASGAEPSFPKRLVLFFTPHGTIYDAWKPTGTELDFTLSPILAPLERHKKKIVVLGGLEILAPGVGAPHTKGPSLLWTGSKLQEDQTFIRPDDSGGRFFGWNSGPSVDQVIAQAIGAKTAYRSLELGVRPGGNHPASRMIFSAASAPLPPEASPYAAMGRLFSTGGANLEQIRAERRSAIDVLVRDLDDLKKRAAADDAMKMDAHLTALRSIETRLRAAPAMCAGPTPAGDKLDPNAVASMPVVTDLQMDIIAAALACDLTRVASLQYRVGDNDNDTYSWLSLTEGHHTITHAGDSDAAAKTNLTKIYTWYADRFAHLLDALAAMPEGNGSVLDNTLCVWGSELGKGNSHSFKRTPFVVAGAAGGLLRTGRYLDLDNKGAGTPHNRLLVSMCHAMGVDNVTKFGGTDPGSGPLPGLLG